MFVMNRLLPPPTGKRILTALAFAALSIALPNAAHAQTPTSNIYAFTDLHSLTNLTTSYAYGIEGGVTVGTGYGSDTGFQFSALRWNADNTVTNLHNQIAASGIDLGGGSESRAYAISGSVTVGYGSGDNTVSKRNALRWNADNTVTNLHTLANLGTGGAGSKSQANAISDGVSVGSGAGSNTGGNSNALRWNADNTVTNLNTFAASTLGTSSQSEAYGIAGGVTVGIGSGSNTNYMNNALRWNADNTVTNLHSQIAVSGIDLGTSYGSYAYAISDGVSVGSGAGSNTGGNSNALRWNADNTVTNLHSQIAASGINLGTNSQSLAYGIAGGVTVGFGSMGSNTGNNGNALRWNADGSVLNLQSFVNNGTVYSYAQSIDATTGVIAGYVGINNARNAALWTPLNAGGGGNSLAVTSGTTTTINQNFTQSAGITTVNGTLALSDGNAGNGAETFTLAGGTLGGSGTITGNVANTGGTVAPGNSPGTLNITGNFAMSSGTYAIELSSASLFDTIAATGSAAFTGGSFTVTTLGGFTPTIGQFFDIVTTGSGISGVESVATPTGYTFTQSGNNGRLTFVGAAVVPEAGTLALVLPALGLAFLRRRNRAH